MRLNPLRPESLVLVLSLLVASLATPAPAAADWPVPRGESREPAPHQYDPAQWKRVPHEFLDDAQACVLYSSANHLIEPDGTIETITHEITRLNSRKAIQDLGEYRAISYNPAYEKLTLNVARVIKPDGKSIPVKPNHVQLRDSVTDYQVYDSSKQLVISYPSLEAGDVIEVKWTVRGKNPEHHGKFFTRYMFGADSYPVVTDELRVRLPKDVTLKYATTGGQLEPTITENEDTKTFFWRATNRPQLPTDDHLPSKEELRLCVTCSTFASWDDVFAWKERLRKECWECTPEIKRIVAETTKGLATPAEKARALTYWVRRHVRYVSVGEGHDYKPHPPAVVLSNRFGDCKDTAQLLAVMLKEAGIPVSLATLGVRGDGQILENVPSPWGTHAILLVTLGNEEHWIDTTSSLAGWDQLPRDDHDRLCYVTNDRELRLVRTPALSPSDRKIEQETRITIGADGSTHWERTATYHGLAALSRRADWADTPAGERRRSLTTELQDAYSKCRLCSLKIDESSLKNFDEPVRAHLGFEVLEQFSEDADQPGQREASFTDSPVWSHLLWYSISYDRNVPLALDSPFESTHKYTIQLPPYFTLESRLTDRKVRSKWGVFQLKATTDPDDPRRIELEFYTRLDKVQVEPEDFAAFRKFHEDVSKAYRIWISIRNSTALADTPMLEAQLQLTPGDATAAKLLADVYLRNHEFEQARRVLARARAYSPDNARLAELAVKAAPNLKEEEAIYRDLIRHFPTEWKYPVALGRNLVEQNRLADARTVLRPVLTKGTPTQRSQAHYQMARIALLDNKPSNALTQYDLAHVADPETVTNVAALRLKASIYEKLKQPADEAKAYRELLALDSDNAEALESLTRNELAEGEKEKALEHLRRFTLVATDGNALAKAADLHLRMDRYEDAFDLASRSRDALEGNSLAQRTLGLVYMHRGNHAKAAFHLERADIDAAVLAGLLQSRLALGELSLAAQDADHVDKVEKPPKELVELCQTVLSLVQRRKSLLADVKVPADKIDAYSDAADRLVCAEYAWRNDRTAAEVESLLRGAFAPGIEIGPAFGLRGLLGLERGRLLAASEDAERAIKHSPNDPIGYLVRGRVRLERGQADALADLKKAADLSQNKDGRILHWLAASLWRAGEKDEARKTQQAAVQLRPVDRELTEQLRTFMK